MSVHRHKATLLEVADPTATAQTGSSYTVVPADGDGVSDAGQTFRVFLIASQSGGATSPTTVVKLETSPDRSTWIEAATSTQLAADGAVAEFKSIAALGPYVRVRTLLAGGTLPNHTVKVVLVSDAPFRILKAA